MTKRITTRTITTCHILKQKLSQDPDVAIAHVGNGVLHSRKVLKGLIWDSVYNTDFSLNSCLRYSNDGRVEFIHL